jgi:hypothetical protein
MILRRAYEPASAMRLRSGPDDVDPSEIGRIGAANTRKALCRSMLLGLGFAFGLTTITLNPLGAAPHG